MPEYDLFNGEQKATIQADRYRRSDAIRLFDGDDLIGEFPADAGIALNRSVVG